MKISIITINYNNANGLKKTLESVACQTYTDIQHVIVDGNSTDGSKDVLQDYGFASTIKISEPDTGIYNAMNKGIRNASGDYLLFLNSGDSLRSESSITSMVPVLKGGKDMYYGDLAMQSETSEKIRKYPDTLSFYYFFHAGSLPHPSLFFKNTLFKTVGLYKEKFKIVADWDYYVNALFNHNATYEHVAIIVSNFDTYGISSTSEHQKVVAEEREMSLRDNFTRFYSDYEELQVLKKEKHSRLIKAMLRISKNKYAFKIFTIFTKMLSRILKK
ncbi:glycosyltransferase family 2 protein [uncultured Dokdonia sp.]|uniref:glycosyltransferase family 2 protein n=1 Tax=uncultured Dokdonia sp. TaxID=575653 RepID=UPI00260F63DD|nr:glycosyltransferase family 2 protein [uncultured Dokdonia sp.]